MLIVSKIRRLEKLEDFKEDMERNQKEGIQGWIKKKGYDQRLLTRKIVSTPR